MNLIALDPEHLRVADTLPFDVVDAGGLMLVPCGAKIADEAQLRRVRAAAPMADAAACAAWREQRAAANAAQAEATAIDAATPAAADLAEPEASPLVESRELALRLAPLLRQAPVVPDWQRQVEGLARRIARAVGRDPDTLLYLLVQRASRYHDNYSTEHALMCAVVCTMCAGPLGLAPREAHSLACAALTMNLSMTALQDELAQRDRTPTLAQRRAIDSHAADSARELRRREVGDPLWIEIVGLHHRLGDPQAALDTLAPGERLAGVLRRIDMFTAKISARRSRAGLPAPLAARDACLGPNGLPDTLGAATVKALGIYPPGSYVRLANSEIAVVVRRGVRVDQPQVVSLIAPNGRALPAPLPRDTALPRHEIKAAVRTNEVRVPVSHEQVLALV